MSWYYASGGKQQGPIEDAQFELMIQSGQLQPADLVWKEGMTDWQPLSTVRPDTAMVAAGTAATTAPAGAAPPRVRGLNPNEVTCAECHGRFSKDEAIQYGSTWVCATCKPVFVQKLKEGAISGTPRLAGISYAGFWVRLAAKMIDGFIQMAAIMIPFMLISVMFVGFSGFQSSPNLSPATLFLALFQILFYLIALALPIAYPTYFNGKYGATPGKMALGLKIVTPEGTPITMMRAFGRAWGEQLSGMTCLIGYIIAAFDEEKRSLHDHICATRVIYK